MTSVTACFYLYLRKVGVLKFVWFLNDISTQAQVFRCGLFEVDEQIPVWYGRCVSESFLHELYSTRIHLSGQVNHLCIVARILEEYHVLCVYTYSATLFPFGK